MGRPFGATQVEPLKDAHSISTAAGMAKPRMDLPAFVGKLLEEDHGDVLREGVQVLAQALDGGGSHRVGGRRPV